MWFVQIPGLLDAARLTRIAALIADAPFTDGRATAGPLLAGVKRNEQVDRPQHAARAELDELLVRALLDHPRVQSVAVPVRVAAPLIARYRPGMAYGAHSDNPFMGQGANAVRTDLSCTIFLADPADYDGGALEIETSGGTVAWKLAKGDALLYPSGAIHRVAEVTRGERLVAVTWLQSRIADAHRRGILADLDRLAAQLRQRDPIGPESQLAGKLHGDLLRMWAEG